VTLNPSIDYIVRLDQVKVGSVNRMDSDDKFAGGKGINVSRVLKRLNIPNTATGFIGGFTGKFIITVHTIYTTNFDLVQTNDIVNGWIECDCINHTSITSVFSLITCKSSCP
ncbi:PfkB family carbohydrate kinase, partial [Pseudomonas aeruginosa]